MSPRRSSTVAVSLRSIEGVDASATPKVYCRLALKQPHRFRFLRSATITLSAAGDGSFGEVLQFEDVLMPEDVASAEGTLVVDVWGIGGAVATGGCTRTEWVDVKV